MQKDYSIEPMFPISVIADILNVHQRTLRIYDEESILKPTRTGKNRRQYTFSDLQKGKFIQYLTRNLGINITGTKVIIQLLNDLQVSQDKYMEHCNRIAEKIGITLEMQTETKDKLSKRGRKKSIQEA